MKKSILLPTDFSKNSWHAIEYALGLYKQFHCNFYVLNVFSAVPNIVDSLLNMETGSALYEEAKLESENGLAKILDMITLKNDDNVKHSFIQLSSFNHPLEAIKQKVEEKDIEMIVMGTKGETNSNREVYGSMAISVMEKVRNCPVIVVPEKAKHELPKEIVFPTGFKTHFKKKELNHLVEIANNCNASIRILHVANEIKLDKTQKNNRTLLEDCLDTVDYSFHFLSNMDIPSAINCFVESRESGMVAFINKKHTFFGSILKHPLVKGITRSSTVPILVLHDLRN